MSRRARRAAGRPPQGRAGRIRIIGGRWRGRRLPVPEAAGLRPTSDRMRETVFNWLAPLLEGARVLDLFAGTGAMGFEAASRGAAEVIMVEANPSVAEHLRRQCAELEASQVRVVCRDARAYLAAEAWPADVVFVDPPFGEELVESVCFGLAQGGWLRPGGRVYVERERERPLPGLPTGWQVTRERAAGQVAYYLIASDTARQASGSAPSLPPADQNNDAPERGANG